VGQQKEFAKNRFNGSESGLIEREWGPPKVSLREMDPLASRKRMWPRAQMADSHAALATAHLGDSSRRTPRSTLGDSGSRRALPNISSVGSPTMEKTRGKRGWPVRPVRVECPDDLVWRSEHGLQWAWPGHDSGDSPLVEFAVAVSGPRERVRRRRQGEQALARRDRVDGKVSFADPVLTLSGWRTGRQSS